MLRSTVIMKTDIRGFTVKVGMLAELDLSALLTHHKQFILDVVAKHHGSIVKGEGDSFWIIFPSVTTASIAATEIQKELRASQSGRGDDTRLAVRIVITLGDVLHQENDIFGEAVNLAARIETLTPADEIYLSHAAWLALNKAEVTTSYVDEFSLKGIKESEKIYKLTQKQRTRIIKNQVIVFTDLKGFTYFDETNSTEDVERSLMHLEILHNQISQAHGGTIRLIVGDSHFITFPESQQALAAIEQLCNEWDKYVNQYPIPCLLMIGANRGDLYQFRSFLYGRDINYTARLQGLSRDRPDIERSSAFVSSSVRDDVKESVWKDKLRKVKLSDKILSSFSKNTNVSAVYEFVR